MAKQFQVNGTTFSQADFFACVDREVKREPELRDFYRNAKAKIRALKVGESYAIDFGAEPVTRTA